jgi:putative endonuclease
MTDRRRLFGTDGEDRAAAWYVANGYTVVCRNWRCREGELDLVVRRGGELVDRFGVPAEAVTRAKQRRLRGLAARYLSDTGTRAGALRFDVVAILAGHLEVIEAAF